MTCSPSRRPSCSPGQTNKNTTGSAVIRIRPDITAVVNDAEDAIAALTPGPRLFRSGHASCVLLPARSQHRNGSSVPPMLPSFCRADAAALRELAAQAAPWQKYDERADAWEAALPPPWAIETLLARGIWRFPPLEGVITTPTLRPDGSLLSTPGYDPTTGLYLDSHAAPIRRPGHTRRWMMRGRRSAGLQTVFTDFLWTAPCHFSASIAAVLSLAGRYAIRGNVPLSRSARRSAPRARACWWMR